MSIRQVNNNIKIMSIRLIQMNLQQIFIGNLKKYRKERGMSQMALSEMCDTTSNYIGQIEMGRRIPSFEKIEKIAEALKITPSQLFFDESVNGKEEKRPETKEFLQRMPAYVKKELTLRILTQIKAEIISSFDPKNYL
jgi:transcriptional regulator with XRE-family HTH domain